MRDFIDEFGLCDGKYLVEKISELDLANRILMLQAPVVLEKLIGPIRHVYGTRYSAGNYSLELENPESIAWSRNTSRSRGVSMLSLVSDVLDTPFTHILPLLHTRLGMDTSYPKRFLYCEKPGYTQLTRCDPDRLPEALPGWEKLSWLLPLNKIFPYETPCGNLRGGVAYYHAPLKGEPHRLFCLPLTPFHDAYHNLIWDCLHFRAPYPLWNLKAIVDTPTATVLIAPDEFTALGCCSYLQECRRTADYVVTTWPGGLREGLAQLETVFLQGRSVLILPHHTKNGYRCAQDLYNLVRQVAICPTKFVPTDTIPAEHAATPQERLMAALIRGLTLGECWDYPRFCEAAEQFFSLHFQDGEQGLALTAPALLALPAKEEPWILDGLLRQGDRAMLYGAKGQGKTWFAMTIAICIASGQLALGGLLRPARSRNVLIVDGEQTVHGIQGRMKALGAGLNIDMMGLDRLSYISAAVNQEPINIVADNFLKEHKSAVARAEVVVLDNLNCLYPRALQASPESAEELNQIINSLGLRGKTIIIINHSSRSGDSFGTSTKELGLDLIIKIWCDSKACGNTTPKFKAEFLARDLPPLPPLTFELRVEGEQALLEPLNSVQALSGKTQAHGELNERQEKILAEYHSGNTTARSIAASTGISKSSVANHLTTLRESGLLVDAPSARAVTPLESPVAALDAGAETDEETA